MAADEIVVVRTERRRQWSDAERARILAECKEPGATVRAVAARHEMAESLIYGWRKAEKERRAALAQPLGFVTCGKLGEVPCVEAAGPNDLHVMGQPMAPAAGSPEQNAVAPPPPTSPAFERLDPPAPGAPTTELIPNPGPRPGTIELRLPGGAELTVDAYVNERAIMRVLCALADVAARERAIERRMSSAGDRPKPNERLTRTFDRRDVTRPGSLPGDGTEA